jgi:hypothetical protein
MNFNEAYDIVMKNKDVSLQLDKATFVHSTHHITDVSKTCIDYYKEKYSKRITNQMHATKNELVKIALKIKENE